MMKKEKIYCFDFDGTLTKKDTLIEFIKFSMGKTRFLMGFLLYSPILVLMKLHLFPNWKAKQIIFKHFFGGMSIEDFDDYCVNFAAKNLYLLRLSGIGKIQEAKRKKERVLIVSASIDNWVRPFAEMYLQSDNAQDKSQGNVQDNTKDNKPSSPIIVLGTKVEVDAAGCLTGRFSTPNCYGPEKVRRIEAVWPHREQYDVSAFGDSRGDKEMLAYADKGYFKPFRF